MTTSNGRRREKHHRRCRLDDIDARRLVEEERRERKKGEAWELHRLCSFCCSKKMNTKRYTFSLVVVVVGGGVRRVFLCLFLCWRRQKKERFFEAYEKGVRSTKEALHEYERSAYKANVWVRKKHSWVRNALLLLEIQKKKRFCAMRLFWKEDDFHLYSVTLDFISVQRTNTKSALIITTTWIIHSSNARARSKKKRESKKLRTNRGSKNGDRRN